MTVLDGIDRFTFTWSIKALVSIKAPGVYKSSPRLTIALGEN